MAGNTATIDRDAFSRQWQDYVTIADLCVRFTVTKDQVIRLRDHWSLERRMDCSRRAKPPRAPRPSAAETRASTETLALSPAVAAAAALLRSQWDEETELRREGEKHAGEQARVERRRFRMSASIPDDGGRRERCTTDDYGVVPFDIGE